MDAMLIAAVANDGVIGLTNTLPWKQKADMTSFKIHTFGHCVIVGRTTWEGLPPKRRPLLDRPNIILTRDPNWTHEGVWVAHSLDEALEQAKSLGDSSPRIIGGGQVYGEALKSGCVFQMRLTLIHADVQGDAFFPLYKEDQWSLLSIVTFPADENNQYPYTFKTPQRKDRR